MSYLSSHEHVVFFLHLLHPLYVNSVYTFGYILTKHFAGVFIYKSANLLYYNYYLSFLLLTGDPSRSNYLFLFITSFISKSNVLSYYISNYFSILSLPITTLLRSINFNDGGYDPVA